MTFELKKLLKINLPQKNQGISIFSFLSCSLDSGSTLHFKQQIAGWNVYQMTGGMECV